MPSLEDVFLTFFKETDDEGVTTADDRGFAVAGAERTDAGGGSLTSKPGRHLAGLLEQMT